MSEKDAPHPGGEIVVYQAEDGGSRIRVLLEGETVWLTQALIAELFQTTVPNVNIHLKNIYAEGELAEESTIKEYLIVRQEGSRQVSHNVLHYSLEAILAVGYRAPPRIPRQGIHARRRTAQGRQGAGRLFRRVACPHPRNSRQRGAGLPADSRDLCACLRLQGGGRRNSGLFRDHAEQDALRRVETLAKNQKTILRELPAKNQVQVPDLADTLRVTEHVGDIGKGLEKVNTAYNSTVGPTLEFKRSTGEVKA